jgi:hypothetical protein
VPLLVAAPRVLDGAACDHICCAVAAAHSANKNVTMCDRIAEGLNVDEHITQRYERDNGIG